MEMVKLFLRNGDGWLGETTIKEAMEVLREFGYKKYYKGRHYADRKLVLVGINKENTVGIIQRRKNGLLYAREHFIK